MTHTFLVYEYIDTIKSFFQNNENYKLATYSYGIEYPCPQKPSHKHAQVYYQNVFGQ